MHLKHMHRVSILLIFIPYDSLLAEPSTVIVDFFDAIWTMRNRNALI